MKLKRFLAVVLLIALSLLLVPGVAARDAAPHEITESDYAAVDALWAQLAQVRTVKGTAAQTAAAVANTVRGSDLYREGTLRWHGNDQFTFETTVGVTCGYSPRLQEIMDEAQRDEAALAQAETATVSYAQRGTTSSMDVYLIEPYYGLDVNFTQRYQDEAERLARTLGGTYHLRTREAATIDAVAEAIEQGGVVIFDSHGETDYYNNGDSSSGATTSYLLLHSGVGLTDADYAYDNGTYHAVYYGYSVDGMNMYAVDGTCIANHMDTDAPNSLLWSGICLGMATDGLHAPLMKRGVGVAYGYSQAVTFYYDYMWEEVFFDQLTRGATVRAAVERMKAEVGAWDLCEEYPTVVAAREAYCAFPIVVSAEDVYPGHGNVDAPQTVNALWTLPIRNSNVLTVAVNNAALGTATIEGNVVTAIPYENALFTGWSLSPKDGATVVQNGNSFAIYGVTANCRLTFEFTAKPVASVHYVVPLGTQKADDNGYIGEAICLTPPSGTLLADAEDYIFCGWTRTAVPDSTAVPEILTDTFVPETAQTTLYALYMYTSEGITYYTTMPQEAFCYAAQFTDVDLNQWYHEYIDFAVGEGYMQGLPGNLFGPNGTLTRAMLVTILYRMQADTQIRSHPFADVEASAWYAEAVAWAYETGVVKGVTETTFCPNASITREQTAAILYRYANLCGIDTDERANLSDFTDAAQCSAYAVEAMQWVVAEGIISGLPTGGNRLMLQPMGHATRAQIATILQRYCDMI